LVLNADFLFAFLLINLVLSMSDMWYTRDPYTPRGAARWGEGLRAGRKIRYQAKPYHANFHRQRFLVINKIKGRTGVERRQVMVQQVWG
jgi:hypothetical protein